MRPKSSSLARPIIYGGLLVLVTLILTVLYNVALLMDPRDVPALRVAGLVVGWAMGLGVITGLILFVVSLARQIRLNQRQQNFIDSVTHELKTPLTSLKLHLETIQRRPLTPEQLAGFTETMLADVARLDGLIDHVLDAARVDSAYKFAQNEAIEVHGRCRSAIEAIARRHALPPGAIALEGEPVELRTDPVGFDLVLSNLLENAVKYSREDVRVTVRVARLPGGGASIAVADQGVGIPRTQIKRIFQRFYRVGNELTRIRKGTGLGLYIVQETVRQLRGRVEAASPGPGKGSTFTLTLPGDRDG